MKRKAIDNANFAKHVTCFLRIYLPGKNFSYNTICSYGDTFLLLEEYFEQVHSIKREYLSLLDISRSKVEDFMQWLSKTRSCTPSTCNNRLAAIKSFVKYASTKEASFLYEAQQILAIKTKKTPKPGIPHLTKEQTKALIESPDQTTQQGRRDLAILALLYDSAARVQELCDLKVCDVRLKEPPVVVLTGKGMKTRTVPILSGTAKILRSYMEENDLIDSAKSDYPLFINHQREKLTRAGVTYILKKYFAVASKNDATMPDKISPHVLRHSRAMHMLQAETQLIYIRDFLGHESVLTTEVYARADPEMKRKAIEKVQLNIETNLPDWRESQRIMRMLKNLGSTVD